MIIRGAADTKVVVLHRVAIGPCCFEHQAQADEVTVATILPLVLALVRRLRINVGDVGPDVSAQLFGVESRVVEVSIEGVVRAWGRSPRVWAGEVVAEPLPQVCPAAAPCPKRHQARRHGRAAEGLCGEHVPVSHAAVRGEVPAALGVRVGADAHVCVSGHPGLPVGPGLPTPRQLAQLGVGKIVVKNVAAQCRAHHRAVIAVVAGVNDAGTGRVVRVGGGGIERIEWARGQPKPVEHGAPLYGG